jgi:hypothetical protein
MTAFDYANRLVFELRSLGVPVTGSFAWSPSRIVLDYWDADGDQAHVQVLPVATVPAAAAHIAGALA